MGRRIRCLKSDFLLRVPVREAPGETAAVEIPWWHAPAREPVEREQPVVCLCRALQPEERRILAAGMLVIQPFASTTKAAAQATPPGPGAVRRRERIAFSRRARSDERAGESPGNEPAQDVRRRIG